MDIEEINIMTNLNDDLRERGFSNEGSNEEGSGGTNAHAPERLRDEVLDRIEYFTTEEGIGYAKWTEVNQQSMTAELSSKKFKYYVRRIAREMGISPNATIINTAVEEVESQADIGESKPTYLRSAYTPNNNIHIFVGTIEEPEYVELNTATGAVSSVATSPVEFIPKPYYEKMPYALSDNGLELLGKYINLPDEELKLLLVWICSSLMPEQNWEYAQANFVGSKGTGKSTAMENVARIIDNSELKRMTFPSGLGVTKATENLFVHAFHNWCLSYDNVVKFGENLAMVLSVFTTGNAQFVRLLFTNNEQSVMSTKRPIILNYISQPHGRSDLLDRSIVFNFSELTGIREDDQTMREKFNNDVPKIRGFIFQTLAQALHLMQTTPVEIDRADRWRVTHFYKLGRHIEKVLNWEDGTFHKAIWGATNNQALVLLQNDEIAVGMFDLTADWTVGTIERWTPTMLMNKIKTYYRNSTNENDTEKLQWWARKTVPVFSRALQNIKDELQLYDLKLTYEHSGDRLWIIEKINNSNSTDLPDQPTNLVSMDSSIAEEELMDDYEQGRLE